MDGDERIRKRHAIAHIAEGLVTLSHCTEATLLPALQQGPDRHPSLTQKSRCRPRCERSGRPLAVYHLAPSPVSRKVKTSSHPTKSPCRLCCQKPSSSPRALHRATLLTTLRKGKVTPTQSTKTRCRQLCEISGPVLTLYNQCRRIRS